MKPSTRFVRTPELLVEPIWVPLKTQHWVPWENPALGSAGDAMNPIWVPPGHASPELGSNVKGSKSKSDTKSSKLSVNKKAAVT
ncbi:hypothetical protein SLEP1_g37148 [Rubroshorea leprosula]|uniref:Uncharacterized protein n=1 Tax=Rubroshorea leprosula TaxID=152421 RepID=A0AAV5KU35_9ROSI|nr:hypothetical protein SLEP1_g37148 [Rubroshorea leprosula]